MNDEKDNLNKELLNNNNKYEEYKFKINHCFNKQKE